MTKQLTKQTIGVGVAGTGFIGPAHVEGLRRNGIQVLGLAEYTKELAQQKAAEFGIPRNYGSLDEMLAMLCISPRRTIFIILTPKLRCWQVNMLSAKNRWQ
jgi:predicted dehydrogenase